MIKFIKIGPYNPIKPGLSKYESIKLLTLNKYNPGIDIKEIKKIKFKKDLLKDIDFVYLSSLKRSVETFDFLKKYLKKNIDYKQTDLLNEIKFDIGAMCYKEKYEREGSDIVRKRFMEYFIDDKLVEKRKEIFDRMQIVKRELGQIQEKYKNILCISHTFFIKLSLIEKENPGFMENNPDLICKYIYPKKRIMDFCQIYNQF